MNVTVRAQEDDVLELLIEDATYDDIASAVWVGLRAADPATGRPSIDPEFQIYPAREGTVLQCRPYTGITAESVVGAMKHQLRHYSSAAS